MAIYVFYFIIFVDHSFKNKVWFFTLNFCYKTTAIYRDVPTLDEIKAEAHTSDPNHTTKIADNAEALIDWALSHIPERKYLDF